MKRLFLLLPLVFTCQLLFCQVAPKDSIYQLMAKEVCKQIIANDSILAKSASLDVELGLLMLPIYADFSESLQKLIPGFEISDSKQMEALGEAVGEKLAFTCPAFLKLITTNRALLNAALDKPEETLIKGTLIKIVTGDFTSLHIRTAQGKIEKLWWMQYFDGANLLMEGSQLLNKYLVLSYSEHEVYNAAQKEYVKIKVIKGIQD